MVLSCAQLTPNHFALLSKERKVSDNSLIRGVPFVQLAYVKTWTVFAKIKGWRRLRTRLERKGHLNLPGPSPRQGDEGENVSVTNSWVHRKDGDHENVSKDTAFKTTSSVVYRQSWAQCSKRSHFPLYQSHGSLSDAILRGFLLRCPQWVLWE